jgi:hypothetical protein
MGSAREQTPSKHRPLSDQPYFVSRRGPAITRKPIHCNRTVPIQSLPAMCRAQCRGLRQPAALPGHLARSSYFFSFSLSSFFPTSFFSSLFFSATELTSFLESMPVHDARFRRLRPHDRFPHLHRWASLGARDRARHAMRRSLGRTASSLRRGVSGRRQGAIGMRKVRVRVRTAPSDDPGATRNDPVRDPGDPALACGFRVVTEPRFCDEPSNALTSSRTLAGAAGSLPPPNVRLSHGYPALA